MDDSGENISNRPVLSIPVSRAEKRVYALYWLAVAVSSAVALLAMICLPEKPVVHTANGSGSVVIRDKYALMAFSLFVLYGASIIALLPRYPLHRSTYFVRITPQNAEAQYKLGRYVSACLFTSIAWWIVAAQTVSLAVWLNGQESPALMNAVLIPMTCLPVAVVVFGVAASRKLK